MTLEEKIRKTLSGGGRWKPNATDRGLIDIAKMLDRLQKDLREGRKARKKKPGAGPKFGTKEWLRDYNWRMRRFEREHRQNDKELRQMLKELDREDAKKRR